MSVNVEELDGKEPEHLASDAETDTDTSDTDETPELADQLRAANDVLKKSAILFEYLSEPMFVKNITKRERGAIDRQVNSIYTVVTDVEKTLDSVDDTDDSEDGDF